MGYKWDTTKGRWDTNRIRTGYESWRGRAAAGQGLSAAIAEAVSGLSECQTWPRRRSRADAAWRVASALWQ
jgi:hypothetical protein